MPITPIVSSENIEGNIGQCQSTSEIINCVERTNLFVCQDIGYVTNSCTGQVDIFKTWSPTGISYFGMLIGALLLVVVIYVAISGMSNKY